MDLEDDDFIAVGQLVVAEALDRFEHCGAKQDFCLQAVGSSIVFGGTNRVRFDPEQGLSPDRSYCTRRFLREWDNRYGS